MQEVDTGLVDCGNWDVSASWTVPANAVSGIYLINYVREDILYEESQGVIVVRDDSRSADILFQTPDTKWQAYNSFQGLNLYTGAYKVSYNRPFVNSDRDWVQHAVYPMVRWLESNGYDVSYAAGEDIDRDSTLLSRFKAFFSVGHDEYWSGDQRTNVENARDSGVHLAFFSGNEVFWKTRWESSIDGNNTPYRSLVCYKETHANAMIDPDPTTWTGTWRDPRFTPQKDGGRPENALTGQIFTVNATRNDSITIGSDFANLRFWRNTEIASLAPGESINTPAGTLGFEWDTDLDNGFRPRGLMRLSKSTIPIESLLLDYGSTFGSGIEDHYLTMYKASSGAIVFGAGTIQWSWGLDTHHTYGGGPVDPNMQQATVNLLADMTVQPATIQSGLQLASASTDFQEPSTTITFPSNGDSFNKSSVVQITGTATDLGGGVIAGVEVSVDGGLTWHPAEGRENWSYNWYPQGTGTNQILVAAIDDSGNLETTSAAVEVDITCPCNIWGDAYTPSTESVDDFSSINLGTKFKSDQNGYITGLRYYRGPANTGTHVGSLWDATGNLLAQVTFQNETATGWQEQALNTPVSISAGATYVVSYHAPNGGYSVDPDYFTAPSTNIGLEALADGEDGGNGVYAYGSSSAFPDSSYGATNYWVDVVFDTTYDDQEPPTVVGRSPLDGATDAVPSTDITATFNEPVQGASVAFELRDSGGSLVAATVSYDVSTYTATLTPDSPLQENTSYTATIVDVQDFMGNSIAAPDSWSFTTTTTPVLACPCTIWDEATSPSVASASDGGSVELGVKFRTDQDGYIGAIRFYKGPANTGTHVGSLWDASGNLLARVTFANETASGWQEQALETPVAVVANTTYVVSYHAPNGGYARDSGYFATGTDGLAIQALADGVDGGNGLYAYSDSSTFPASTFGATNYWVDAVFLTSFDNEQPPTVESRTPANGSTGVLISTSVAAVFSEDVEADSIVFELRDSGGALVPATVSYNSGSNTATLTPDAVLQEDVTYTATVLDAVDLDGTSLAAADAWSFTTLNDDQPPSVVSRTPADGAADVVIISSVAAVFSEPVQAASITFELRDSGGTLVPATVSYDGASNAATLTPDANLGENVSYTATVVNAIDLSGNSLAAADSWSFTTFSDTQPPSVTVRTPVDGAADVDINSNVTAAFSEAVQAASIQFELRDLGGTLVPSSVSYNGGTDTATLTPASPLQYNTTYTATVLSALDLMGNALSLSDSWTFTTGDVSCPCSVWEGSVVPSVASSGDPNAVELGMKFRADADGFIQAIRFYKGAANTGTHVGSLWDTSGNLLGQVTFQNETASGWQEQALETPVPVVANTTYVVSYHAPNGNYSRNDNYFATDTSALMLRALADGEDGGNGLYAYGPSGTFPDSTYGASNYWVDVVFDTSYEDQEPPSITSRTPLDGATDVVVNTAITAVFSEPMDASTIEYELRDSGGSLVPSIFSYNSSTYTATVTPNSDLQESVTYTATITGAEDLMGNALPSAESWSFTTFGDTEAPSVTARTPLAGATDIVIDTTVTAVFSEEVQVGSIVFELRDAGGSLVSAAFSYDSATNSATLTPNATLLDDTIYTATVVEALDLSGNPLAAEDSWSFTTVRVSCPCGIWDDSVVPSIASGGDPNSVELGMKFRADRDGFIKGIRFYKGATNTGTHVGSLWDGSGNLLAQVTFENETATGWQEQALVTPIPVVANATYVVSYHAPNGGYSRDDGYFVTGTNNLMLRALADGEDGGNGLYAYSGSSTFPTSTFGSANYWVDAVFDTTFEDQAPAYVTSRSPADGDTDVVIHSNVTATFNESVQAGSIVFELRELGGSLVPSTISYDSATNTVTLDPDAPLVGDVTYTATVVNALDLSGNAMSEQESWSFTPFSDSQPPSVTGRTPVDGSTDIAIDTSISAVFSERVRAESIVFELRDSGGALVPSSVTYDSAANTATLTPDAVLQEDVVYTATIVDVLDLTGNAISAQDSWSFTTMVVVCPCSVWDDAAVPSEASASDGNAVELGMKFQSDRDGYITGIRFYKGAANTGTHVGSLWDASGILLGQVTFVNETASGWQEQALATPVAITANTTYVVSYHAPNGGYARDFNYFETSESNLVLDALSDGEDGGNGVYAYGASGSFPASTYEASNYWVDVVFTN